MNISRDRCASVSWTEGNKLRALVCASCALAAAAGQARAEDPKIAGPSSFVRVLHAIPAGSKVDVSIDGNKTLNDYEFGGLSKYLRVSPGRHTFRITTNNPSRVMLSGSANLRGGSFYTIIARGTPFRPRLSVANESAGTVPYNRSRVSVYHLSPGSPRLDVLGYTAAGGAYRLLRGIGYGQSRNAGIASVPMTIKLRANGRVIKTVTGFEPRAGRRYSAFVIGRIGGVGNKKFQVLLDASASQ